MAEKRNERNAAPRREGVLWDINTPFLLSASTMKKKKKLEEKKMVKYVQCENVGDTNYNSRKGRRVASTVKRDEAECRAKRCSRRGERKEKKIDVFE